MYNDDIEMYKLKTELSMMEDLVRSSSLSIKHVTNVRTICEILNKDSGNKKLTSAVSLLYCRYISLFMLQSQQQRGHSPC